MNMAFYHDSMKHYGIAVHKREYNFIQLTGITVSICLSTLVLPVNTIFAC